MLVKSKRKSTRKSDQPIPKSVKAYVQRAIKQDAEHKYLINVINDNPYNADQACFCLANLAQGTGASQYLGQKISPTSLEFRFSCYKGLTDCLLRVIIFRAKDELDPTLVVNSRIYQAGQFGGAAAPLQVMRLLKAERDQFEILHDKMYIMDDGKQNGVGIHGMLKLAKKDIMYSGTTINSLSSNNIYLCLQGDTALANAPVFKGVFHLRYTDQ